MGKRKDTRKWSERGRKDKRERGKRVRNRGSLSDILPPFHFGDLYTYFKDLYRQDPRNKPRNDWAKDTAAMANARLDIEIGNLQSGTDIVQSAISFLEKIAASERQKELNAIMQYKDKLLTSLQQWQNAPELARLIGILNSIDLNTANLQQFKTFNLALTKAINLIRQQQNDFIARLERILNNNAKIDFTTDELFGQQIQYRLHGDVESILKDLTGKYVKKESKADIDNYSKIIRDCAQDYLFSNKSKLNSFSSADIMALFAAVATDIEILAQQEFNKQQMQTGNIEEKITPQIVQQVCASYKNATQTSMTRFQKLYQNNNINELNIILDNMKKAFGIKEFYLSATAIQDARQTALDNIAKLKGTNRNQGAKELQKTIVGKEIFDKLLTVKISAKTNQVHGNVEEGVVSILRNAILTEGRTATDMLSLGSLIFNFEIMQDSTSANMILLDIKDAISNFVNNSEIENRFETCANDYEKMNDKIRELIDKLKKQVINDPNLDQLFIFHESIKSYMSVEGDVTKRGFSGFHGVQMQIFTAFDRLYSISGGLPIKLMDMDALKFIALNLSSGALGDKNKEPLEKYLSIFAGMLMFDDIKNMAIDAAIQISSEPVQQVHVYLLNDMYVPSSVILTNIANQLKDGLSSIDIGEAARAIITTSGIDEAISTYNPHTYNIGQWNEYAETARTSTLVTIYFFKSFVNFLGELIKI